MEKKDNIEEIVDAEILKDQSIETNKETIPPIIEDDKTILTLFYKNWIMDDFKLNLSQCKTEYEHFLLLDQFLKTVYVFSLLNNNFKLCKKIREYRNQMMKYQEKQENFNKEMVTITNNMIEFLMKL